MIVFDLICGQAAHRFEGWFGSSLDYETQKQDGLLICPICGSAQIEKAMMAPNVGSKGNQQNIFAPLETETQGAKQASIAPATDISPPPAAVQVPAEYKELIGKLAKAQKEALAQSEYVGDSFAEEARSMHYGESDEKPIHGTASPREAEELSEEGIDITALPLPIVPPETQN